MDDHDDDPLALDPLSPLPAHDQPRATDAFALDPLSPADAGAGTPQETT